jgi:twitching motility protein PilJ
VSQFSQQSNPQDAFDAGSSNHGKMPLAATYSSPGNEHQNILLDNHPPVNQSKPDADPESLSGQSLPDKPNFVRLQQYKSLLQQRFLDLPIRDKQFTVLLVSQVVSVIGLVGVGALLIVAGGRSQLVNQAKSELVVTEINYNIKVDQMGFGFRGQADNTAIIAAAKAVANGETIDPNLRTQVRKILQNEVKVRKIEYATLVDRNLKIIANANADRTGEQFNPNNLVSQVFNSPGQFKVNAEIVSWAELAKESPRLPKEFSNQDALVRYIATPVKDLDTGVVIGALISGDIVNGKTQIVDNTVNAFEGGYSGVYLRQPTGKFVLVTALSQGQAANLNQAKRDVSLPDTSLLEAAVAAKGNPVTKRMQVGEQTYTMAAKILTNFAGQPVAVLLRGTPEKSLNTLIKNSLLLQFIVTTLAIAISMWLAIMLGRVISKPIKKLQQTTQKFSEGNFQVRAQVVANDEVGQLAGTFNTMADRIESNIEEIRQKEILLSQEAEIAQQARQQAEEASKKAEILAREQRQQKEELQRRALDLLQEIDPISRGNLTIEAKVTDDEIGTIADSYNTTVESLREIVLQVQESVSQVAQATSSNDAYIQGLSIDASRQAMEIAVALQQVQEMMNATQKVAANAEEAKTAVQQAAQIVEDGDAAMNRAIDGIRAIRATVAETAKKVKHLGESSQKISTIVELIGTLTEQTRMLALNASIEAALAGEEGRGFAIVADEVRALSRQSAEAAEEIRKLVVSIQTGTNEVMVAMNAGTQQVVIGTELVDGTRQNLNKITTASVQINQLVTAISEATVVQSQASEAVSQTMKDVAAIANKTSVEASQASSSFEQLQTVARALQEGVSRFKVN